MTRTRRGVAWARRFALEALGWALIVIGLAALVLPGPGLLALVAGLVILAQRYEWAARRVEPVKEKAFQVAADGVRTWPRIFMSCAGAAALLAVGVAWGMRPPAPSWWPLGGSWWLPGGWGTGSSLIASAVAALAMIAYSFRRFRHPAEE